VNVILGQRQVPEVRSQFLPTSSPPLPHSSTQHATHSHETKSPWWGHCFSGLAEGSYVLNVQNFMSKNTFIIFTITTKLHLYLPFHVSSFNDRTASVNYWIQLNQKLNIMKFTHVNFACSFASLFWSNESI
jgi:hypothetical protein